MYSHQNGREVLDSWRRDRGPFLDTFLAAAYNARHPSERPARSGRQARVAELVDALDLGSSDDESWGFESPLSHGTSEDSPEPSQRRRNA